MRIYLAGWIGRKYVIDTAISLCESTWQERTGSTESSEVYANLLGRWRKWQSIKHLERNRGGQLPYVLESFYYCRKNPWLKSIFPYLGDFLLDSGAFTFMQDSSTHLNWDEYTEEYAAWIVENNIEKFFELDIDSVVGLKEVERLRRKLEYLTGRLPIPVWHKNRGLDYFKQMCYNYPYVTLGGIALKEFSPSIHNKIFPWFIREAHIRGTKIHGLGYTNIAGLHRYHFDSVDSTSWLYGNRGGYLYRFNSLTGEMEQYQPDERGRLESHSAAVHNFLEWLKFQKYAEKNL